MNHRFFSKRLHIRVSLLVHFKKYPVLFISGFLAIISCFIVPPDAQYFSYINFRVLGLLFCLMGIVAGMKEAGAFDLLSNALLKKTGSLKTLVFALVALCFFLSMFLTNDVALVTVVPFTILVFGNIETVCPGAKKSLCLTLALETVSANLGSMLTPIGNPQNLYLFSQYEMSLSEFLKLTAPYTILSFAILSMLSLTLVKKMKIENAEGGEKSAQPQNDSKEIKSDSITLSKSFYIYLALFVLALLTVARVIHWIPLLVVVAAVIFFQNKKLFMKIDFALLVTFVFFFVFVGNMGRIPSVNSLLAKLIEGREVLVAVCASQIISNVPAALLLSTFTTNGAALVIGTNLGGLGTLVASMASLITYKFCAPEEKGRYLLIFSVLNFAILAVLFGVYLALKL